MGGVLTRTSRLREKEREFERERQRWERERAGLLDRIMVLADKPWTLPPAAEPSRAFLLDDDFVDENPEGSLEYVFAEGD